VESEAVLLSKGKHSMPEKRAVVHYSRWCPEHCDNEICAAVLVCPYKLFRQEVPYGYQCLTRPSVRRVPSVSSPARLEQQS
jgi:hypothetical protein